MNLDNQKVWIRRYQQNGHRFISFIIDFASLNGISQVLVYDESKYGYQRKPDKKHYLKIKKYLLEDQQAMLPLSVMVGVDSEDIEAHIGSEGGHDYLDVTGIGHKIFRVVDGQHRLKGIKEAAKVKPELASFMINVVAIETEQSQRYKELNIFTDINSKGKRIRVDLALLAKYNYEIYGGHIESLSEHIAVKTAYKLKENMDPRNVWRNGINFDIHEEKALGIVSVNAFVKSILPMCNRYLRDWEKAREAMPIKEGESNSHSTITDVDEEELFKMTEEASEFLAKVLLEAWTIVAEKWGGCFTSAVENDYFYDIKEFFYNRKYYIQKTLGVRVLNTILYESIRKGKLTDYNLGRFYRTIIASNVNISNWSTGDIFAGLSSESGFKVAKSYVLNKGD